MANGNGFTNVQRKMMAILDDGKPHTDEELYTCLRDDLSPMTNIRAHLTGIRKIIRPKGRGILVELVDGKTYYRQVQFLAPADD